MSTQPIVKRIILITTLIVILLIGWMAIEGGVRQLNNSLTIGQLIETIIQLACGLFSLLTVITCFFFKKYQHFVRISWDALLTATAGLSSIVWGPAMILIGLLFSFAAFLIALAVIKILRYAGM